MASKNLPRMRKLQKSSQIDMTKNFSLHVDENDNRELLNVVPEESTNEKLLELGQRYIAEEEARESQTSGEEKRSIPNKIHSKELSGSFWRSQQGVFGDK